MTSAAERLAELPEERPLTREIVWQLAEAAGWPEAIFTSAGGMNTWLISEGRGSWQSVLVRAWPALLRGMAEALDASATAAPSTQ